MENLTPSFPHCSTKKHLAVLRQRLSQVASSWAKDDYRAFVTFSIRLLPKLMNVERCAILIRGMGRNGMCSVFGTGHIEKQVETPQDGSIVGKVINSGLSCIENDLQDQPGFPLSADEQTGFYCRNMLCTPLKSMSGNIVTGVVELLNKLDALPFTEDDVRQLEEVAQFLSISIESIILNKEILRIAGYLNMEVGRLEQSSVRGATIIAESPAMREVLEFVAIISNSPINVIVQGENGTGKELIARMIHERGERKRKPFVPVNCACIPENLVESEFFGHEKGAFTGAGAARKGLFEEASGGTLFLDEIAEMPLKIQPKFLRAIQEGEGARLGSNKPVRYDLRLISATNKDLAAEVKKGLFRDDLFFRLFSVEIFIPPLRKRQEDILPLALHFLEMTNRHFSKNVPGFSPELLDMFEQYPWPGNVRQLLKEVERLVALTASGERISIEKCSRELLAFHRLRQESGGTRRVSNYALDLHVRDLEVGLIKKAMRKAQGNKSRAAELLHITRQGLLKKMKRYQVDGLM